MVTALAVIECKLQSLEARNRSSVNFQASRSSEQETGPVSRGTADLPLSESLVFDSAGTALSFSSTGIVVRLLHHW